MTILSHRGYWEKKSEKNSLVAFKRSFKLGFGTETDIRDFNGQLVISHDIPDSRSLKLKEFFDIYNQYDNSLPLALNIKADGLQFELKRLLNAYNIENYFVFDMSVPDGIQYIAHRIKVFTRKSEFEQVPSFYNEADGVWLDEFKGHWISCTEIAQNLVNEKKVCIVSPDLHKRGYTKEWEEYKSCKFDSENVMLCTDYPEEAKDYFNEN